MDELSSLATIDQKMAEMRIKNLELLKRHQEIEEDRQLAGRLGVTKVIETMRGTTKNRTRITTNQQHSQEIPHERMHRPPVRRKFENDRNDIQPQRAQRVDYNRLKCERAQEITSQKPNNSSIKPELHEYAHPFHYQSENNNNDDADEPAHAKKLVIVNNKAGRIGSGRFSQQQRAQEQGQRKREERMRRCTVQNNGQTGGTNEFHLDVPPMPMWQNAPVHVQLIPTNINSHHRGLDHLINTSGDQIDQSAYIHNFVYSSPATPFNGNGTVYFAHPSSPLSSQTHFHQYHPTRTFENSNRQQFPLPPFQSSPIFQPPLPQSLPTSNENPSTDLPTRFRRLKTPEQENKQRPMSTDFDRLYNSHHSSSARFNNDNRFQVRPQSFYDFSSNNNNNNNIFRSSNNNRQQRNNNNNNNNTSLPLSAYMNTDDSLNPNEHLNNHWGTAQQRRRLIQPRTYHQDKHQFPLSSYDPRQYGFNNNSQRRNDFNNRSNTYRRYMNNNRHNNNNELNHDSNDIDLIEEWWEDNNTELIGTDPSILNTDSKPTTTTTVDDSGNSSLSTSMNLKETTLDDFVNPPSDISTTDSNIIESLDKLQQQLKLEEAVDERLASTDSNKEPATYDTAHFMQWAKEKFREELAGRLTAQEIEQHDAVTTDDEEPTTNNVEKMDALEDDLNEKLTIDENLSKSVVVE